jgi:hypothetical protein
MYRLDGIETWREHRNELLEEAEDNRLARQLSKAYPKREGPYAGRMRRRVALLLSTIGLAVLLAASAAYALDVPCEPSTAQNPCLGPSTPTS